MSSKILIFCTDHDRFRHRIHFVERQSESDAVVVQLTTRVAHRINGRTADAVGRGEKYRQPGKNFHR